MYIQIQRKIFKKKTKKAAPEKTTSTSNESPRAEVGQEVIVEPQGGSLWGKYEEPETDLKGGKLWGEEIQINPQKVEEKELPPIGAGGSLWGPRINEEDERKKFQEEIWKVRGVESSKNASSTTSAGVSGQVIIKEKLPPQNFTYFYLLINKDILDDSRYIDNS